jgi:hypothetical protein
VDRLLWPRPLEMAGLPVFVASARSLNFLAAFVWYVGALALLVKGSSLLIEAEALNPRQGWPWLSVAVSLAAGGLKARFLFSRSCQKNLDRIAALEEPRLWQFFRPGFFAALAVMIATGASLSRLAHGDYAFLIAVAALDLAIGTALLASGQVFWKQKAFARSRS